MSAPSFIGMKKIVRNGIIVMMMLCLCFTSVMAEDNETPSMGYGPHGSTAATTAPTQQPSGGQSATKAPSQTAAPTAAPEATAEPSAVPTEQPAAPQGEGKTPENVAVTPQGEGQAPQPAQPNRFPVSAIVGIGIGAAVVIAAIVLLFVRRRK